MNLLALRPKQELIDARYAYWALSSTGFRASLQRFINKAVNQASVSTTNLKSLSIPLPPLEEQRRIARILDKADALRARRKRALELLDGLTQSIFLEMFGDPLHNAKNWPRKHLGKIASIDASLVDPTKPDFSHLLHYGPDRIERDTGRLLPAKTALEDQIVSDKFLCDENHILYSKIRPYLNKVALAPNRCLCSADVYPVSWNESFVNRH